MEKETTGENQNTVTDKIKETAKKSKPAKSKETITAKTYTVSDIDYHQQVDCINGTHGPLIYVNPKTQEVTMWSHFGDIAPLEVQDLITMKNSQPKFFTENWLLIDHFPLPVIKFLKIDRYYKNALTYDEFDELFSLTPEEIKKKVAKMSTGMKNSVAFRALHLIEDGKLDSLKVITALEEALSVTLVEK